MVLDQYLGKKYQLKSSEHFEEYLKFIGINFFARKTACALTPISVLTKEGDIYTFSMVTAVKTITFTFKIDEEFDEERGDGCKLKSRMTVDGDTLIQIQTETNGRKSYHKRTFTPDELTVETSAEGWHLRCLRIYTAIP